MFDNCGGELQSPKIDDVKAAFESDVAKVLTDEEDKTDKRLRPAFLMKGI